jgi:hypothetical protein
MFMLQVQTSDHSGWCWFNVARVDAVSRKDAAARFRGFLRFYNERHVFDEIREGTYRVRKAEGQDYADESMTAHYMGGVYTKPHYLQAQKVCAMANYA